MFYVRPIARDDLPSILALSERTGTGLTSLPANRERLASRIDRSLASFAGQADPGDACYMFVLVHGVANAAEPDRVVGISAIEAAVGLSEPWYNYHVGTLVHASRQLGVYTSAPTLFLSNDHTGHTELCSLFLDQAFRQGKNGVLLAKCRLLFIAEFASRFAARSSPNCAAGSTATGAARSGKAWAATSSRWNTRPPITSPASARSRSSPSSCRSIRCTSTCYPPARATRSAPYTRTPFPRAAMLEQEGFRYEGYVDIFDAGPTLECFRDNIHAVRQSQVMPVTLEEEDPVPDSLTDDILWLVCNRHFADYRAIVVAAPSRADRLPLLPYAADALRGERRRLRCALVPVRPQIDERDQFRRHSRADAQLLRACARQPRVGPQREPGRQSARSGAAGTGQDVRARRARPAAGRAAAARAAGNARAARDGISGKRRRGACARGARGARIAGRLLVGRRDVGG
jgi:arginine N-succinyltransferase